MILCDAGPLVALIDRDDPHYEACVKALPSLRTPLLSTWPCFTEAMYLLYQADKFKGQKALWRFRKEKKISLVDLTEKEMERMEELMEKYFDCPMDLADASLVVLAERLNIAKIFTLDKKDFHTYRIHDTKPFEVVP